MPNVSENKPPVIKLPPKTERKKVSRSVLSEYSTGGEHDNTNIDTAVTDTYFPSITQHKVDIPNLINSDLVLDKIKPNKKTFAQKSLQAVLKA